MTAKRPDGEIPTVVAHIEKYLRLLGEAVEEIGAATECDLPKLGKTSRAAVLVAGLLENYYTCAETLFLRLSQFFENHLETVRWHKDLLEKMTLEIESIRPRLLSDETYVDLRELMRFRHFKRYYFGTAYDWTRLDELLVRMNRVHPMLVRDIVAFKAFLRHLDS